MTSLKVRCAKCGAGIKISAAKPGTIRGKCPRCQTAFEAVAPGPDADAGVKAGTPPATPVAAAEPTRPAPKRADAPGAGSPVVMRAVMIGIPAVLGLGAASVCCVAGIWFVASREGTTAKKTTPELVKVEEKKTENPPPLPPPQIIEEVRGHGIPFEAIGKRERLREVKAVHVKGKVRFSISPNTNDIEIAWESLKRMKYDEKIGIARNTFAVVLKGDQGWVHSQNRTIDLQGDGLGFYQNFNYATILSNLIALTEEGFVIEKGTDHVIRDKKCYDLLVKRAGRPDLKMYFEKDTDLLFKADFKGRFLTPNLTFDPNETYVEFYFSEYEVIDGIKHWKKQEQYRNGQRFAETTLHEVRFLTSVEDSLFEIN